MYTSVLSHYVLLPIPSSGEQLEAGIQNIIILEADEALVVTAIEEFNDVQDGRCGLCKGVV